MDLEFIEDPESIDLQPSTHRQPQRPTRHRELNPALFGSTQRAQVLNPQQTAQLPHLVQNDQQIAEMKHQVSHLSEVMGQLTTQVGEVTRHNNSRFEKLQAGIGHLQAMITKLEQNDHYIVNEAAQKFSQVNSRFADRRSMDAKIQDMIDRHNSILKSFEMRLNQMQRVVAEKEAQLVASAAALNEAKMEIARLKRL